MESFAQYLVWLVSLLVAHKLVQAYLRRFRAVWWQGLIILLPGMFVGKVPLHFFDNVPMWLGHLSFWLCILNVILAFVRVYLEQKPAKVAHS